MNFHMTYPFPICPAQRAKFSWLLVFSSWFWPIEVLPWSDRNTWRTSPARAISAWCRETCRRPVYVDTNDDAGVIIAANKLCVDVHRVTGP